ncbi:deoxyribose-phosphate aldolase [Aestuariispira insulae]|uniref:Deoxyribose-phosphate aldolase n=1 Tax=Aestuariispira insulae TaxID=1461337 RepID=A0A3D9HMZ8_9PROT|nr:deoxyribose-phosphate aldolase [Aestuariispira insulae]RED50864.1 deoxyribose-phosphate aldolase [Aestuariispira insulae]
MTSDKDIAKRALSLLDLTSLNDTDSEETIRALCAKAVTPHGHVAAVCVWPRFVALAAELLKDKPVKIAAVSNFPDGGSDIDQAVHTSQQIIEAGGDEVDVVFPYRAFLRGDVDTAAQLVAACKKACGEYGRLKVILETGCMPDADSIRKASELSLANGADFIKTSTGKVPVSATPEAAKIMLETLRDTGSEAGFKPSGGIKDVATAGNYLALADKIMGEGWVNPDRFRFGASGVLTSLIAVLDGDDAPAPASSGY